MDAAPPNQPATAGFANTRYQVCAGVNDFMAQMSITSQPPAELRGLRCTPVCFGFFLKIKFPQSNDPQILLTSCFVDLHSCHPRPALSKNPNAGKVEGGSRSPPLSDHGPAFPEEKKEAAGCPGQDPAAHHRGLSLSFVPAETSLCHPSA